MYLYLLFDADDTLFDFRQNERRAFRRVCALHGLPDTEAAYGLYHQINGDLWREFEAGLRDKGSVLTERFRRLGEALGIPLDPARCTRDHEDGLAMPPILIPGAEEVCRRLARRHRLYLITNAVAAVQRSRFAASPLPPFFRDVFVSESVGWGKPAPQFFQYVFDHVPGITRENCLVIGDSLTSDIRGANNFGLPCCWFNPRGLPAPPDLRIDCAVSSLPELLPLLGEAPPA